MRIRSNACIYKVLRAPGGGLPKLNSCWGLPAGAVGSVVTDHDGEPAFETAAVAGEGVHHGVEPAAVVAPGFAHPVAVWRPDRVGLEASQVSTLMADVEVVAVAGSLAHGHVGIAGGDGVDIPGAATGVFWGVGADAGAPFGLGVAPAGGLLSWYR